MKDIDFDELDRAVSSALGGEPEAAANTTPPAAGSPAPVPSPLSVEPVVPATPDTVPSAEIPLVAPKQASPAVRRGGRFMDVVHPSSDMKTSAPAALRVPKRTFGPISDDLKATTAPVATPVEPNAVSAEPTEPFPTLDTLSAESSPRMDVTTEEPEAPKAVHTWPDPLDLHPLDEASKEETVESEPTEELEKAPDEELVAETPPSASEDSTQTPFLADTKVDKRPLGAFAEYEPESGPVNAEIPSFKPIGAPTLMPPELESDLVAIESNEMPVVGEQSDVKQAVAPTVAKSAVTLPTSPSQRYHAEEKTTDTDTHSVFDTAAYHQPLLPQKTHGKNRAWVWVLIIVGLLVVGAGLGALFFMAGF